MPSRLTKETSRDPKEHMPRVLQMLKQQSRKERPSEELKALAGLPVFSTYDVVKGTAVDYMHCVLGVTKSLLNMWFSPSLKKEPYNVADKVKEVDDKLSRIKPPNDITRCQRKIINERQYWKASEFHSFMLFYGPVVFRGVLPDEYYRHFIFLSEAIFVLLGDSIFLMNLTTQNGCFNIFA